MQFLWVLVNHFGTDNLEEESFFFDSTFSFFSPLTLFLTLSLFLLLSQLPLPSPTFNRHRSFQFQSRCSHPLSSNLIFQRIFFSTVVVGSLNNRAFAKKVFFGLFFTSLVGLAACPDSYSCDQCYKQK